MHIVKPREEVFGVDREKRLVDREQPGVVVWSLTEALEELPPKRTCLNVLGFLVVDLDFRRDLKIGVGPCAGEITSSCHLRPRNTVEAPKGEVTDLDDLMRAGMPHGVGEACVSSSD